VSSIYVVGDRVNVPAGRSSPAGLPRPDSNQHLVVNGIVTDRGHYPLLLQAGESRRVCVEIATLQPRRCAIDPEGQRRISSS
jgi:hypothetical protein